MANYRLAFRAIDKHLSLVVPCVIYYFNYLLADEDIRIAISILFNSSVMTVNRERPTEAFADIIKKVRLCSALVGADVASPNFRINWVTYIVMGSIIAYFIFSIITIIEIFEENPTFLLEASCMLGSVLQGVAKLLSGFVQTKRLVATRFELEDIYADYQEKGEDYCNALKRSCKRMRYILLLVGLVYFLSVIGIVSVPFIVLVTTDKRPLMMHFLIPGLEIETNFGYFVTMAAHSICIFCGAFGLYAGDLFVLIFLSHAHLFADILQLKIKKLNANTEMESDSNDKENWLDLLGDIIKWHQKYTNFNTVCNKMFYVIITVQITTSGISIVCTLFIILTGDWPGVYAYIWLPLEALYIYCLMGTQIEICNERFIEEIYNIKWFNLPPTHRKMISIMLIKSQNPARIDVAGMIPLTVSTALQISKSIFSIFMMMTRFVGDEE